MNRYLKVVLFWMLPVMASAQLNPMGSVYFQNQFLANTAIAGIEPGVRLNGAMKAQWVGVEGGPRIQALTADYGLPNEKVGLGFLVYNESAGVINRTRLTATYAYHLSLNSSTDFIDFGLSAGLLNEWVDVGKARGDLSDEVIGNFNDRRMYLDGDFGIAYRNDKVTLQAALPNLKRFLKRDEIRNVIDRSLYFFAAGYKIRSVDVLSSIEPKIVYRGVQNYRGILDVAANLQFLEDKLMLSGIYHSTDSMTIGVGANYKSAFSLLLQYTTNTAQMQSYSNGEFELGLKYSFGNN